MLVYFKDEELEHFYVTPLNEIKGKYPYPKQIIEQYKRKVQLLKSVKHFSDLRKFRSLNFEKLKGKRKENYSIRLNDQYRLILRQLSDTEMAVLLIEISKNYE